MPALSTNDEVRFFSFVADTDNNGCMPWMGSRLKRGYGKYHGPRVPGQNRYPKLLAHRVMWEIENGPIPEGMLVCHKCDVPACCNPQHLFLGTQQDNMADMASKGRSMHGEKSPHHKLTEADVLEIRSLCAVNNQTKSELARRFKVSVRQIDRIVTRQHWKHV